MATDPIRYMFDMIRYSIDIDLLAFWRGESREETDDVSACLFVPRLRLT